MVSVLVKRDVYQHEDIMALLEFIDFGSFNLKQILDAVFAAILACGIIGLLTSLIGSIGGFFTIRLLLIIVSMVLMVL